MEQNQAIGRSRGGRTTKIHALCDAEGRLYALMLTGGQVHDIKGAIGLLTAVLPPAMLLGDKAYDADHLRNYLAGQGTAVVVPNMPSRWRKEGAQVIVDRAALAGRDRRLRGRAGKVASIP